MRYETTRKDVDGKIILKRTFSRAGESELDFTGRVEESGWSCDSSGKLLGSKTLVKFLTGPASPQRGLTVSFNYLIRVISVVRSIAVAVRTMR